jgi:hypothetical protein
MDFFRLAFLAAPWYAAARFLSAYAPGSWKGMLSQSAGNPISVATQSGFNTPPCTRAVASVNVSPECRPLSVEYAFDPLDFASDAVAVGHNKDPSSTMRRSSIMGVQEQGGRSISKRFKVASDERQPLWRAAFDVFDKRPFWSKFFDDSTMLSP